MTGFGEGGLRDLEMNHEGMAGDCLGGPFLRLATSVRILTDRDFLGLPLVWWCLSVDSVCSESYPRVLSASALSHVALECASSVDQACLHCGASLGASLHDLVSDSRAQVCQEQVP